jgi:hypothetical protein
MVQATPRINTALNRLINRRLLSKIIGVVSMWEILP